jgi:hypothetical protein
MGIIREYSKKKAIELLNSPTNDCKGNLNTYKNERITINKYNFRKNTFLLYLPKVNLWFDTKNIR